MVAEEPASCEENAGTAPVFPVPRHIRAAIFGAVRALSAGSSSRHFAVTVSVARPAHAIACTLIADIVHQRGVLGEIVPAERHGVVLKLIAQAIAHRLIEIVVAGFKKHHDVVVQVRPPIAAGA